MPEASINIRFLCRVYLCTENKDNVANMCKIRMLIA
mgnify:CR=1 FL=1